MLSSKDTFHSVRKTDVKSILLLVELLFPQNHSTDNIMLVVINLFIYFLLC